jgi:hypothetical protein
VQQKVMKRDVDYGIIPGCQKPSLYKSGAEILLQTFEMGALPEQEDVQDLGNADEIRYRVVVPITHIPTGRVIGNGVGECSSNEDKYKWRKMVCEQEFEETDPARRRIVWKHGRDGGQYQAKQVRTNPSDLANTILKMAKKRALVDGTMTVTAASRNFTQDVEDLPREYVDQGDTQHKRQEDGAGMGSPMSTQQASDAPAPVSAKAHAEAMAKRHDAEYDTIEGHIGNVQPYKSTKANMKGVRPGLFDIEDASGRSLVVGMKYFDPDLDISSGLKRITYKTSSFNNKEQYTAETIEAVE